MNIPANHVEPRKGLNITELIVLSSALLLSVIGLIISHIDVQWFENVYLREDSFIENITLIPLLIAAAVSISYMAKLSLQRSWLFTACMVFALAFSIFIAGEEVSWGQRIFNIESSGFFKENNAQKETNLHNLVVNGKKVNKVVFSAMLFTAVSLYLIVLPILYRKRASVRNWADWAGIPVPHTNEILAAILLFIITELIPSGKNAELREMGITAIFLLILLYPYNVHIFRSAEAGTSCLKKAHHNLQLREKARKVA